MSLMTLTELGVSARSVASRLPVTTISSAACGTGTCACTAEPMVIAASEVTNNFLLNIALPISAWVTTPLARRVRERDRIDRVIIFPLNVWDGKGPMTFHRQTHDSATLMKLTSAT